MECKFFRVQVIGDRVDWLVSRIEKFKIINPRVRTHFVRTNIVVPLKSDI